MSEISACIVLALLATTLSNLGLGLQKAGAGWMRHGLRGLGRPHNLGRGGVWVAGILMGVAAPFALGAALDRGPASLVSALGAFGLVPLYLFAWLVLKEPLTRHHRWALVAIAAGVGWLGWLGARTVDSVDRLEVGGLLGASAGALLAALAGVGLVARLRSHLLGVALGCLAGTLSGLALVCLKVGAVLDAWWASGGGWVALSTLAFLVLQVAWFHGRASQVVPASTALSILVPVALAPAAFGEPLTAGLLGGVGAIAVGVALLG